MAVDVEKAPGVTAKAGIMGTPTVIFYKDKKEIEKVVGARPKEFYEELIKKHT